MKLRLSVTNGWRPPFFCCGTQWDSHVWQMQTMTMIDIWTWSALVKSGNFPLQTFPLTHQTKWPEKICQTSDNDLDKSNPSSAATISLSKGDVHSGCLLHSQINHHIIRNEEASCEKGIQSNVSAKSVPSWVPPQFLAGQDFLSNSTQCTQKNRKTFWMQKSKKND